MKYYLAVDAGTTKLKAAILDERGGLVDQSERPAPTIYGAAADVEMDMDLLWVLVKDLLRELSGRQASIVKELACMGICAQGDGAWLLDERRRPLRKAILWNDRRAGSLPEDLAHKMEELCLRTQMTGLFSGASPMILRWLKKEEVENYRAVKHVIHCKDWLLYCLSGLLLTDETDASTALFNIYDKNYQMELLEELELTEMIHAYPAVRGSGERVASIGAVAAQETGIPEGTPLICGALDVAAVAAGLGLSQAGERAAILGTTLANLILLDRKTAERIQSPEGSTLCFVKSGFYFRQMSALNGAGILSWAARAFAEEKSFSEIDAILRALPPRENGAIFLPYLSGERAPFKEPEMRASFHGLHLGDGKDELLQAVYEGLVFSLVDCQSHLPAGQKGMRVAGGAAGSDYLCQMISDACGEVVTRCEFSELGIMGLFQLMRHGEDEEISHTELSSTRFEPRIAATEIYRSKYTRFASLREKMLSEVREKRKTAT